MGVGTDGTRMMCPWGRGRSLVLRWRALVAACALVGVSLAGPASAQTQPYWLDRGKEVVKCPGETAGDPNKLANAAGQWGDIQGLLNCVDDGTNYRYELQWLRYRHNPEALPRINRNQIKFDWIGLAVYRASPSAPGGIEWLYEDAFPVAGVLDKTDGSPRFFGNLKFSVPKQTVDRGTNFVFYLTAQGMLQTFFVPNGTSRNFDWTAPRQADLLPNPSRGTPVKPNLRNFGPIPIGPPTTDYGRVNNTAPPPVLQIPNPTTPSAQPPEPQPEPPQLISDEV